MFTPRSPAMRRARGEESTRPDGADGGTGGLADGKDGADGRTGGPADGADGALRHLSKKETPIRTD